MFEKETIELYHELKEESIKNQGEWQHSPVENWKIDYFARNLNEKNLINFRRTPLSGGLINPPDRSLRSKNPLEQFWFEGIPIKQKLIGIKNLSLVLCRLKKQFNFNLKDILDNGIGNPCYYGIGKIKITDFSIRMCYFLKKIEKEFATNNSVRNILEIGGGCGGLCLKLAQSTKLSVNKFVFIDLPECIVLAYYYLVNNQLNTRTLISAKKEIINDKFDEQVLLLPPWLLPKLNMEIDLFINTMSFQHMTKENIDYYLFEIDRLNVKNLFLINRDWRRDKTDIRISEYPIPSKHQLIKEEKYPFSKQLIKIYNLKNG